MDDAAETPMQRAQRLKKTALKARRKRAADAKAQLRSAAMPTGASKPWMKN